MFDYLLSVSVLVIIVLVLIVMFFVISKKEYFNSVSIYHPSVNEDINGTIDGRIYPVLFHNPIYSNI
jgi:hypothetical protein